MGAAPVQGRRWSSGADSGYGAGKSNLPDTRVRNISVGYEAKETEHPGPKRGNGAYWGYQWEAKKESNRIRRENWKRGIRSALADSTDSQLQRSLADEEISMGNHLAQ